MKIKILVLWIFLGLISTSCASTTFYQLYNVKPIGETLTKAQELFFEDDNCKITYNLWSNYGDIGFYFQNRSDENIYLLLNQSFFVLNGFAYDYYQNRTYTASKSSSLSAASSSSGSVAVTGVNTYSNIQTNRVSNSNTAKIGASVGYGVSFQEDPVICVPPNSTKKISEFSIYSSLIRDCDLLKYPKVKDIKTVFFTNENSPIIFSNRISYKVKGELNLVENSFFVSEITNYPRNEFFESEYEEYCGQKDDLPKEYFKYKDSDRFYFKYSKDLDFWEH